MLKHFTSKTILLQQNGFCCKKNESSLKSVRLGLIGRGCGYREGFLINYRDHAQTVSST